MSRTVVDGSGVLLEQWDDTLRLYTRFVDGQIVEERPYTVEEDAVADAEAADTQRKINAEVLRGQAAAAMTDLQTFIDTPLVDLDQTALAHRLRENSRILRRVIRLVADVLDGTD